MGIPREAYSEILKRQQRADKMAEVVKKSWTPDKPKRSKYRNIKTVVNGITFASKKEAEHYKFLKMVEDDGQIQDLKIQPRFKFPCGITYVADFSYVMADGSLVVTDVKGFKTAVYRLKLKMFKHHYPEIDFREI